MNFITFAWGKAYVDNLPSLKKALAGYGQGGLAFTGPGEPTDPNDAKRMKPDLLLGALKLYGGPVAWVDADACVKSNPDAFGAILAGHDIAVHRLNETGYTSCIVGVNETQRAIDTLIRWKELCNEGKPMPRKTGDEEYLSQAIEEVQPKVAELGPAWAWSNMLRHHGDVSPIFEFRITGA